MEYGKWKYNFAKVLEELKIPFGMLKPILDENEHISYTSNGNGLQYMWMDEASYQYLKGYFNKLPVLTPFVDQTIFDVIETDQIVLSALIDRALEQGNEEEFMRLTAVYKNAVV